MDELRKLVRELETAKNDEQIVNKLQKIGAKLIREYIIMVGGLTIEPLWVEAYYYNKNCFPDCNAHLNDLQRNRFGQLYFHRKGHGGFDICLSLSEDYYLSYLLKATLINGKFCKQTGICSVLKEKEKTKSELENANNILYKRNDILNYNVKFVSRVGVVKSCYRDEELAAFPLDVLNNNGYDFTFAHKVLAPIAEKTIVEYKKTSNYTEKECLEKCKELFGWVPDNVRKILK